MHGEKMHWLTILYRQYGHCLWPDPLMGKTVVDIEKGKKKKRVTEVSISAVFNLCAIICKYKIIFICLKFMSLGFQRCPTFWHLWATLEEGELSWATH